MSRPAHRTLVAVATAVAALALGGCTNPDAPSSASSASNPAPPRSPGEPAAPAAPAAGSQAPARVRSTPQAALEAFARLYINWSYETLAGEQQTLAAISVGAARLAEQQAAATSHADGTISQGHIHNSGQVVSLTADDIQRGMWVLVTREQTGGDSNYQGLPAAYHVTLARLAALPGGYAVSEWLPQS